MFNYLVHIFIHLSINKAFIQQFHVFNVFNFMYHTFNHSLKLVKACRPLYLVKNGWMQRLILFGRWRLKVRFISLKVIYPPYPGGMWRAPRHWWSTWRRGKSETRELETWELGRAYKKIYFLGDISPIRGVDPPPAKKNRQTKNKRLFNMPWKNLFYKKNFSVLSPLSSERRF